MMKLGLGIIEMPEESSMGDYLAALERAYRELQSKLTAEQEARQKAEVTLRKVCESVERRFHGYDIDNLPEVLISLSAKLFNNGGVFWEATIDQMPSRVQRLKDALEKAEQRIKTISAYFYLHLDEHGNAMMNFIERDIENMQRENEELKAKIDSLMLEYCQDEMTPAQLENWTKHQVPAAIAKEQSE